MPSARCNYMMATTNDSVYIYGGWHAENLNLTDSKAYNDLWKLDLSSILPSIVDPSCLSNVTQTPSSTTSTNSSPVIDNESSLPKNNNGLGGGIIAAIVVIIFVLLAASIIAAYMIFIRRYRSR